MTPNRSNEILIIGDPWDTLDHARDSSLHLATIARHEFGMKTYWAVPSSIFREHGLLFAILTFELTDLGPKEVPESARTRELTSFHSVHWRVDPPVDLTTMRLWSLIASTTVGNRVPLVNSPEALLKWNEKFAPVAFKDFSIGGMVSDDELAWKRFFDAHKGEKLIAKPSGEAASRGVRILDATWPEALETLREMRHDHGPWLVIQQFQGDILSLGETRIFLVHGEIAAAINKKPHPDQLIMNLDLPEHQRPTLNLCTPNAEQKKRAHMVADALAKDDVHLATIDFIGDRILEINVTSPGLIKWIDERLPKNERIGLKYWDGLRC